MSNEQVLEVDARGVVDVLERLDCIKQLHHGQIKQLVKLYADYSVKYLFEESQKDLDAVITLLTRLTTGTASTDPLKDAVRIKSVALVDLSSNQVEARTSLGSLLSKALKDHGLSE